MSARPILLVEDDPSLRDSLRDFLADQGFTVHTADCRARGWEMIVALRPALCVLDLNLPDGCGLDLLRNIVDEGLDVRVIVLTALPLQHLRPQYPPRTLAAWLNKPLAPEQLLEAVRSAMEEQGSGVGVPGSG